MPSDNDPPGQRRITLEDLAQAAGISRSAASKAMRNHPRISEATRAKVQALAEEMGYQRDPALSRLAKYRWSSRNPGGGEPIAFLYPYHSKRTYDESFRQACEKVALANGFVFHAIYAGDYTPANLRRVLHARGIRGVFLQRIVDSQIVEDLRNAQFTCVAVDEGNVIGPCELIRSDYLWCISDAIKRHRSEGRNRLALVLRHGIREAAFADRMRAIWKHEGLPEESVLLYNANETETFPSQLEAIQPEGIVSFLRTPLPPKYEKTKNGKPNCPQYTLRLMHEELEAGGGYFLSVERIAQRALHYLESHLNSASPDILYGTTLMRPEWVPPIWEK